MSKEMYLKENYQEPISVRDFAQGITDLLNQQGVKLVKEYIIPNSDLTPTEIKDILSDQVKISLSGSILLTTGCSGSILLTTAWYDNVGILKRSFQVLFNESTHETKHVIQDFVESYRASINKED